MNHHQKLPRVLQRQTDPFNLLPRDLRRAATETLNRLRQTDPYPLLLPIEQAYVVKIALDAAKTQNLIILREAQYE